MLATARTEKVVYLEAVARSVPEHPRAPECDGGQDQQGVEEEGYPERVLAQHPSACTSEEHRQGETTYHQTALIGVLRLPKQRPKRVRKYPGAVPIWPRASSRAAAPRRVVTTK